MSSSRPLLERSSPAGWRRFDTLGLRLFVLMWVVLVGSHLLAYFSAAPGAPPGHGDTGPGNARPSRWTQLPPLPSLPPTMSTGDAPPPEPPASARGMAKGPPPRSAPRDPGRLPTAALWWDYGVRLFIIALGAALGARWLARPMARLARAAGTLADHLARAEPLPQLDERQGTREVREASQVFNQMATRLQAQFDARSLHMAAISHDLRTPLTRLRLRLEQFEGPQADAAIADIRQMNALIDDSLAVLREQRDDAAAEVVDALALVQALVDDLAEQGLDVSVSVVDSQLTNTNTRARPAALRRIVDNLLANAVRHGRRTHVTLRREAATLTLWVDDDGPGIPPEQIEQAFRPWVRLSADAEADSAGHGLGLAIARDLAERESGSLSLANRAEGGLRATLRLPAA